MKRICIFLALAVLLACEDDDDNKQTCIDPSKIEDVLVCPDVVDQVCGCDNKTYENECVAKGSGVTTWTAGACP
jgi:hypothetical protein